MAGSTADSPAPPADVVGTKLKTRLLKEMRCRRGRQPPQVLWPGTRTPTAVRAAWCCWDVDTTQWEGCNHVAPTRDQMEVVYAGTSQEGYLPPISYWRVGGGRHRSSIVEGEHEVTLADGSEAHRRVPVWSYLAEVGGRLHAGVVRSEITGLDPAAHRGVLHGVGHASRGPDLRQRRHSPAPGARPDRQLHAVGARDAATSSTCLGQLRRARPATAALPASPVDEQATGVPGSNMPQEVKWTLKGMQVLAGALMCPPMDRAVEPVDPMNMPGPHRDA